MHIKASVKQKRLGMHLTALGLLALECLFGCPFYRILGISCPGCGVTRAWLCFLHGDWSQAVSFHLFFLPMPLFIFLFAHRGTDFLPKSRFLDAFLIGFACLLALYHFGRICLPGTQ